MLWLAVMRLALKIRSNMKHDLENPQNSPKKHIVGPSKNALASGETHPKTANFKDSATNVHIGV
jgi:hypothetical protein|tara:strand:- start:1725 stop:1916 length:192 start_codon:yes stop_codon:yes gene_type:complete